MNFTLSIIQYSCLLTSPLSFSQAGCNQCMFGVFSVIIISATIYENYTIKFFLYIKCDKSMLGTCTWVEQAQQATVPSTCMGFDPSSTQNKHTLRKVPDLHPHLMEPKILQQLTAMCFFSE